MKKIKAGERLNGICSLAIRSVDERNRTIDFVASTPVIDRYDSVVQGWTLANYAKNPVVLFGHDSEDLPVGRSVSTVLEADGGLSAKIQFAPPEIYPFADTVYKMYLAGYLNAVSVGFIPGDTSYDSEANVFVLRDNDLLEISCVPVPANPEALMKAVTDGGLQIRGWKVGDKAITADPVTPTAEARAALNEWATARLAPPPVVEPTEAEQNLVIAQLALEKMCQLIGVPHAAGAKVDFAAIEAKLAAPTPVDAPSAFKEIDTVLQGQDEKIERLITQVGELYDLVSERLVTAKPTDTGASAVLKSILERATRLAERG